MKPEGLDDKFSSTETGTRRYFLHFLNKYQIPWYGALIGELTRRTGASHVLWTLTEEETATAHADGRYDRVVNLLQDFTPIDAETNYEANLREIRRFEERKGHYFYNRCVAIDRYIRMDEWSRERIVAYSAHLLRRMKQELSRYGPAPIAVFGEIARLADHLALAILEDDTRYFHFATSRHWRDRLYWNEREEFMWPECVRLYQKFVTEGIPTELEVEAERVLQSITGEGRQPFYAYDAGYQPIDGSTRAHVRDAARRAIEVVRRGVPDAMDAARRIPRRLARIRGRRFMERIAQDPEPGSHRLACFFLHDEPETIVDGPAFHYRHQLAVVENVAACLPADMTLMVKEHLPMVGRRELSFYRKLDGLHNVVIVPGETSSHPFIKKSSVVFTLAGTPALEAMYYGVPAVIFSNMFFQHFDGIYRIADPHTMETTIRAALERPRPIDRKSRLAALAAMYAASQPGILGFFPQAEIEEAANLGSIVDNLLNTLAEEVHGGTQAANHDADKNLTRPELVSP